MVKFAAKPPADNIRSIVDNGLRMLNFNARNRSVVPFGITPIDKIVTVPARILPPPTVRYNNQTASVDEVARGSWNLRDRSFTLTKVVSVKSFAFVAFKQKLPAKGDLDELQAQLKRLGVITPLVGVRREIADTNESTIRRSLTEIAKQGHGFIIVVLPGPNKNDTSVYSIIKRICDVELGILNICIVGATLHLKKDHGLIEYCSNIAMKVNLKLRGINHMVNWAAYPALQDTMMIGLDVTHPSPGSSKSAPSIGAIVASIDNKFAQFPGEIKLFPGATEITQDAQEQAKLESLFRGRLELWHFANGKLPRQILLFRDGVSEGQYEQLLKYELPRLQSACRDVYKAKKSNITPKITMIVVGKRHNVRFYPKAIDKASSSSNPLPCTIVDRGITEAVNWDFYVIAQHAIQGTARPAHYIVVYDEIFTPQKSAGVNIADQVQQIVLATHFCMGRATKSISYCAPAYYADLLAERGRVYLSEQFQPSDAANAGSKGYGKARTDEEKQAQRVELAKMDKMIQVHNGVKNRMFYI
jgi:eukaryotic translation initiation factor 2C